jgi:hypothetical protein
MHFYEITSGRGTFWVRAADAPAAIRAAALLLGTEDFTTRRSDLDPMTISPL